MIFGMSISAFTLVHVVISLIGIGIFSGFVVLLSIRRTRHRCRQIVSSAACRTAWSDLNADKAF